MERLKKKLVNGGTGGQTLSREILFRGKFGNDWKYGYLSVEPKGLVIKEPYDKLGRSNIWHIIPSTICQYTGLTDKNGKKIFEGDIVEFEDAVADCYGYHDNVFLNCSEISFCDGYFFVKGTQTVTMDDLVYKGEFDGKVIGNIHDNPELLDPSYWR